MAIIKVSCGAIETNGILTVNYQQYAGFGWNIVIQYKGKDKPILLRCKDEQSAKNCYEEISNELTKKSDTKSYINDIEDSVV